MIRRLGNVFVLDTKTTTYVFGILPSGHLEHLYYGERIWIDTEEECEALKEKHYCIPGCAIGYSKEHSNFSLEDIRLEMSGGGKGDIREPFVEVVHADGSYTSDFLFSDAKMLHGKIPFETLPGSYEENNEVEELVITLVDGPYQLNLELHYYVFEKQDVISRSAKLINTSTENIILKRLMSTQLDFETDGYILTTFHGSWAREMQKVDMPVLGGKVVNESYCGCSSNHANPFIMLSKEGTMEDFGPCYGMNLIYSGNHYEAVEINAYGKTRVRYF